MYFELHFLVFFYILPALQEGTGHGVASTSSFDLGVSNSWQFTSSPSHEIHRRRNQREIDAFSNAA